MQSVYNQYFKNLLYCQPETTKRVVSCFSRLLNLVDEQLSMLEFIYKFKLYTIIYYTHAQSKLIKMMNLMPQKRYSKIDKNMIKSKVINIAKNIK